MDIFIKKVAIEAGKIIEKKFGRSKIRNHKSHSFDFVIKADIESNDYIVQQIKKKFPDHGIISEELGNHNINKSFVWVIGRYPKIQTLCLRVSL